MDVCVNTYSVKTSWNRNYATTSSYEAAIETGKTLIRAHFRKTGEVGKTFILQDNVPITELLLEL